MLDFDPALLLRGLPSSSWMPTLQELWKFFAQVIACSSTSSGQSGGQSTEAPLNDR